MRFEENKAVIEEERPGKRRRILVYPFDQPVNHTNPSENILQFDNNNKIKMTGETPEVRSDKRKPRMLLRHRTS